MIHLVIVRSLSFVLIFVMFGSFHIPTGLVRNLKLGTDNKPTTANTNSSCIVPITNCNYNDNKLQSQKDQIAKLNNKMLILCNYLNTTLLIPRAQTMPYNRDFFGRGQDFAGQRNRCAFGIIRRTSHRGFTVRFGPGRYTIDTTSDFSNSAFTFSCIFITNLQHNIFFKQIVFTVVVSEGCKL